MEAQLGNSLLIFSYQMLQLFFAAFESVAVMVAYYVCDGGLLHIAFGGDEVVESFISLGMLGGLPSGQHRHKLVGDAL